MGIGMKAVAATVSDIERSDRIHQASREYYRRQNAIEAEARRSGKNICPHCGIAHGSARGNWMDGVTEWAEAVDLGFTASEQYF